MSFYEFTSRKSMWIQAIQNDEQNFDQRMQATFQENCFLIVRVLQC